MNDDCFEDKDRGILIDDDLALDIILLEEMEKEGRQIPRKKVSGGCLTLILFV